MNNDIVRRWVERLAGRFVGTVTLPTQDVDCPIGELKSAAHRGLATRRTASDQRNGRLISVIASFWPLWETTATLDVRCLPFPKVSAILVPQIRALAFRLASRSEESKVGPR